MNNLTGYKSISYLSKILNYLFWFIKCILIFKRPFFIVYKYIKRNTPITTPLSLRNGLKIILSTHPHDIVTAFVVFVKGDYGKVEQGTTVVDIGANIGIFSLYAASMGATTSGVPSGRLSAATGSALTSAMSVTILSSLRCFARFNLKRWFIMLSNPPRPIP
jgi:hypothetical protein